MKRLRRKVLLVAAALFGLGASLAAEPTAYFSDSASRSLSRAHWTPGSTLPMSAFEQGDGLPPTPH
jgi:hypothetical protein